ncbi:MAG: 2-succinylbenzoate--CoA ligase, partial [Cyanobacteria bacterium J06648_11]
DEAWWMGADSLQFARQVRQHLDDVEREWGTKRPRLLICDHDPAQFLAGFLAACIAECPVFLGNPDWGEREWQQVEEIARPQAIWGDCSLSPNPDREGTPGDRGQILIPTGGSSGEVKFAIHTWETLSASVAGFRAHFQRDRVDSFCTLPLYHVSGLMQFVRSFLSGGRLVVTSSRQMLAGEWTHFDAGGWFLSLVPTQLQRAMSDRALTQWLAQFDTILVGGAPTWPSLLDTARAARLRLAPTYGATETASQVATLKPDEFLTGRTGCGRALPHAEIAIASDTPGEVGAIAIQARSMALGYYPNRFLTPWQPDDLGYLDREGYLHVVGRASTKILTGGENVFPAEVEAVLQATGLVRDVVVRGVPDTEWGEAIAAFLVLAPEVEIQQLQNAIAGQLARYKQPKYWVKMRSLPRNERGKIESDRLSRAWQHWEKQGGGRQTSSLRELD